MSKVRIAIAALTLSAAGFVGILNREGFEPVAYPDPVHGTKLPTIGFGSTEGVKMGDTITPVAAVNRSLREVRSFENALKACINVPLHQYEYDAYVELSHNIGPDAFCSSTIVNRLNAGDYPGACEAILLFKRAGKQDCSAPGNRVCAGLWKDRLRLNAKCKGGVMELFPQSRALPFLAGALLIAVLAGGGIALYQSGHSAGEDGERKTWQAKWDAEAVRLATARAKAEQDARAEEKRRQAEVDEVRDHAQEEIAQAQADAAAAGIESGRLREQARRLAARASQCASNPGTAQGGSSATELAMVLADLLSRADERAGELAAAYDRARASGLACERAYDALQQQGP